MAFKLAENQPTTYEHLQEKITEYRAIVSRMSKTIREQNKVHAVLIAAGIVRQDKFDQALSIVREFDFNE